MSKYKLTGKFFETSIFCFPRIVLGIIRESQLFTKEV